MCTNHGGRDTVACLVEFHNECSKTQNCIMESPDIDCPIKFQSPWPQTGLKLKDAEQRYVPISGTTSWLTMVHGSINEVSILHTSPSVPSMESYGGQSSGLCVRIQTLYHQHVMLQALAAITLPL